MEWRVCRSVSHVREPCKNGWTDRDAVWGGRLTRVDPRNNVLDGGGDPPQEEEIFTDCPANWLQNGYNSIRRVGSRLAGVTLKFPCRKNPPMRCGLSLKCSDHLLCYLYRLALSGRPLSGPLLYSPSLPSPAFSALFCEPRGRKWACRRSNEPWSMLVLLTVGRNARWPRLILPPGLSRWLCRRDKQTDEETYGRKTVTLCFPFDAIDVRIQLYSTIHFGTSLSAGRRTAQRCASRHTVVNKGER